MLRNKRNVIKLKVLKKLNILKSIIQKKQNLNNKKMNNKYNLYNDHSLIIRYILLLPFNKLYIFFYS